MNWSFAEKSDLPAIRALLCRREWECVSLTGRLLSSGAYRLPASGRARIAVRRENGRAAQVLYMAKSGIVIPYFPGIPLEDSREAEAVREIFQQAGGRISVLPGLKTSIEVFTAWVGAQPLISVDYYLMVRGDLPQETPLLRRVEFPYLEIRRAKPADFNAILPLQEAYEKEEILFQEEEFDSAKMRDELKLNLKTQLIYLGFYAGELIVKGGTNARGFTSDQIGGVYTRPDFRNKRVARFLMRRLLGHIFADGKTACLFVKKHNLPALRLYAGLGFRIAENYRISYF
ncbi:MAG: GNAT family N-acetyltransferase [Spirochaetales bacterium]|jgi:ribosomal protein S18 acetylase RimI-like enzyme|nr:GNAT family N-acetyltransferase [Spirochaetales bacterium]